MQQMRLSRRALIGGAFTLGATALVPGKAMASLAERRLSFRNVHNNERVDARYYGLDGFDPDGLAEINHGLRDWRTGDITRMDHDLLDLLVDLRDALGVSPRMSFDLISGYRSPRTNARLRAEGGGHSGVANRSQHLLGKASDIALPGVPLDRLRTAALSLGRGGVGYYPRDGFVHVDSGPIRRW